MKRFKFITLFFVAFTAFLPSCTLAQVDDGEELTFPDKEQGDVLGADGVWKGRREWTGKLGAKFKYEPGACKGRIKYFQVNKTFDGTDVVIPDSGYFDMSVEGPCNVSYRVTVVPVGNGN